MDGRAAAGAETQDQEGKMKQFQGVIRIIAGIMIFALIWQQPLEAGEARTTQNERAQAVTELSWGGIT